MSKAIIAAIRKREELHGALLLTAIELAHRASGNSGIVHISYSYLAMKCHQSRRTAIRHIKRLLAMGIIRCQRFYQCNKRWGINRYIFQIAWKHPGDPVHSSSGDTLALKFPTPEEEEKNGSLHDLKTAQEKVLSWLTKGSRLWEMAQEAGCYEKRT